jgi:hypothetical protein
VGESSMHASTPKHVSANLSLSGGIQTIKNVTYIRASGFVEGSPFQPFFERAKTKGWKVLTIDAGHDVVLDNPEDVTRMLLDAVR